MPPETDTDTDPAAGPPVQPAAPVFRPTLPTLPTRQPLAPPPPGLDPTAASDTVAAALQAAAAQSARYLPPPVVKVPVKRKKSFMEGMFLWWLVRLGITGLVAAGTAVYKTQDHGSDPVRQTEWDERVVDHVDFVEDERGLRFAYAIEVRFLPEDEFVALFDSDDVDADERASMEDAAADVADVTDAAGLSTNYDPIGDDTTLSQVSILGFYEPGEDRITLRGDELTPAVEAVLVHELTHALQAQSFTVQTGGPRDLQARAVLEADAMRIEDAFVEEMTDAEREQVYGNNFASSETDSALSSVPWAVIDQAQAPYTLGRIFLRYIIETSGKAAVDDVFENLPTSEELVNPRQYGAQQVVPVPKGTMPTGAMLVDDTVEWSYYDALLMLDAWLPWTNVRAALDGWSTASITTYSHGGPGDPVCFGPRVLFDTPEQAAAFANAVTVWSGAAGSTAVPVIDGVDVTFEACPRPAGAADPPTPVHPTSDALWVEDIVVRDLTTPGTPPDPWSVCVARALVDDPNFAELAWVEVHTPEQDAAFSLAIDTAKWLCGAPPV